MSKPRLTPPPLVPPLRPVPPSKRSVRFGIIEYADGTVWLERWPSGEGMATTVNKLTFPLAAFWAKNF